MTKKNAEKCVIEWLFLSPLAIYAYHPSFLSRWTQQILICSEKKKRLCYMMVGLYSVMEYAHPRSIG